MSSISNGLPKKLIPMQKCRACKGSVSNVLISKDQRGKEYQY